MEELIPVLEVLREQRTVRVQAERDLQCVIQARRDRTLR
jgi:hypothetical protein